MVKLPAMVENLPYKAMAAKESGADAISAINTLNSLSGVDIYRFIPHPQVDDKSAYSGLSGPAIKPVGLRCVAQIASSADIPISGIGGIVNWEDAVEYDFISGGGGPWYSRTLNLLEIGKRVWVNIPGKGYVGVGEVVENPVKVDKFMVKGKNGNDVPITTVSLKGPNILRNKDDEDRSEYLVRVKWLKALKLNEAVKETGFFGNQNTVCKPVTKKWQHTVERLKKRFEIE